MACAWRSYVASSKKDHVHVKGHSTASMQRFQVYTEALHRHNESLYYAASAGSRRKRH
jgi:hypothetical protein